VSVRALLDTKRYWLPLGAAVLCLLVASLGVPPVVMYVLTMAAVGLCLDAGTAWLARAGGTGGMKDFKQ
jgi:hypothetical protein